MEIDYKKRMKDLREDSDYTQEYVAHFLGTSQTMSARYERGANELPIRHLLSLCKLYKVSADYLLGLSNQKNSNQSKNNPGISTITVNMPEHSFSHILFIQPSLSCLIIIRP